MKTVLLLSWGVAALAIVWEPSDFGILVNIAAVGVLGLIAWLIKKGIASYEQRLEKIERRQDKHSSRLWAAEKMLVCICAKQGIELPKQLLADIAQNGGDG